MLGMYKSWRVNIAIVAASLVLFGLGTWLVRSQTTVQETSYHERAMIPHHSIAILTLEGSEIEGCQGLRAGRGDHRGAAPGISEMEWLIDDIARNGGAVTSGEAPERPTPEFEAPPPAHVPEAIESAGIVPASDAPEAAPEPAWATGSNVVAIPLAARAFAWAGFVLAPAAAGVL